MAGEVKRFKKVLHVREVERQLTQSELAERMREESVILRKLDAMKSMREQAISDFCNGGGTVMSPQQLWFERQNIDVIERDLDTGARELAACRERIEMTKSELVERHRSVELMERHVQKLALRDYRAALAVEQNNLDDITSMRGARARREAAQA